MDSGFPLVMLAGPLVAAAVALVIRRWRRATAVVGVVTAALLTLLLLLAAPGEGLFADNTFTFYGREIILTPLVRGLFLFIYPAFGVLAALTWFRPLGRTLVPAGLAALVPLAAALMVSPAGFGAVWLVVAAAGVTPPLYGGRYDAVAATWRHFLLVALAIIPLLLITSPPASGWDTPWVAPALAVLILMAGFPFYIWVTGLGHHASPAALTLVLGLAQIVPVIFVLSLIDTIPAGRSAVEFQMAVGWSAALTALLAVFLLRRPGEWPSLLAGIILFDMAFLLAAALAPGANGLTIALQSMISRFLSLLLITLGLESVPVVEGKPVSLIGRIELVLRPVMLAYGFLSLVGLPLTPGFAARWSQVAVVGQLAGFWPPALLVSALFMATFILFRQLDQSALRARSGRAMPSTGVTMLAVILLGIAFLLGVFPNLLQVLASRIAGIL